MGILADAFLLVVDPLLKITVDPLRRNYRAWKKAQGKPVGPTDFSCISCNTGSDTLIARNLVLFWMIYGFRDGGSDGRFLGTEEMLRYLSGRRDSSAYPGGYALCNDISRVYPSGATHSCVPA